MSIHYLKDSCFVPCTRNILDNLLFVQVSIEGNTIPMVFDTGASISLLSSLIPLEQSLTATGQTITGGGNAGLKLVAKKMLLKELTVGCITLKNQEVVMVPHERLMFFANENDPPVQVQGFLGWDVLKNFKWSINLKENLLKVEKSMAKTHKKNLFWDSMPIIQITHESNLLNFGLDTGNTETMVSHRDYFTHQETYLVDEKIQGIDAQVMETNRKLKSFPFMFNHHQFQLNHITLLNRPLFPTDTMEIHGILGMDFLEESVLTLDYPQGFISVTKL